MGARGCTEDEAFALLVELSQTSNRKLRDVAASGWSRPDAHRTHQLLDVRTLVRILRSMATAAALREIEDDCPWRRAEFRAGLAVLAESTAEQARRFAADVRVLAGLAGQVPRCAFDERGATPWTSFRREVAVARRVSERAAAGEIRTAVSLTGRLPRMLALLGEGRVTVPRARAFVEELEGVEDDVACLVDARLADRVAGWSVARIVQETRRAVPTADPDEAARRSAQGTDNRAVSCRGVRSRTIRPAC
jgi:hypothetical protein